LSGKKKKNTNNLQGREEFNSARQAIHKYQSKMNRDKKRKKKRNLLPNMFELNATFIQNVLKEAGVPLTLHDLRKKDICATQFRFGDYWFRKIDVSNTVRTNQTLRDKRRCKTFDKENDDYERCFESQATILLEEACPDPSVPVFLATDWDEFAIYMCKNHRLDGNEKNENALSMTALITTIQALSEPPHSKGKNFLTIQLPMSISKMWIYRLNLARNAVGLGSFGVE
jgi:hypothetical protein